MRTLRVALSILALAFTAGATTVQYVGHGPVNDGSAWVGPYNLKVDGVEISGTCVNSDLHVAPPYTWEATEMAASDFNAVTEILYLEAWWLVGQFAGHPGSTVPIHHGIWDIFGGGYADGVPWVALAAANYQTVDPNSFVVLKPVLANWTQTFLIPRDDVPEPVTWLLAGTSLCFITFLGRRQLRKR